MSDADWQSGTTFLSPGEPLNLFRGSLAVERRGRRTLDKPGAHKLDKTGQNRDDDDAEDKEGQVILHHWHISKKESPENKETDPEHAAKSAVGHEMRVDHAAHTGDKWGKSTNNGQEACEYDCLAAMLLIKNVRFLQMGTVQQARVCAREYPGTKIPPDPVIGIIAAKCCQHKQYGEPLYIHCAGRRNGARHEQQRVPRKKWHHYQPGFAKNNEEQDKINPAAIVLNQPYEVAVQVQDNVNKRRQKFQSGL